MKTFKAAAVQAAPVFLDTDATADKAVKLIEEAAANGAKLIGIRERFEETGSPKNLTLLKGVSVGDKAARGGSRIALDGLAHMEFRPAISPNLREMDARLFRNAPMGLSI